MGAVLKGNIVVNQEAKPCRFNFADIRAEASAIIKRACEELDNARKQAETIKQQAIVEAERIREHAKKQGFEQGYQEGLRSGIQEGREQALQQARTEFAQKNSSLIQKLNLLIDNFQSEREYLLAEAHQQLIALAIAIASKVIHKQVQIDSNIALENLKSAIELISDKSSVVVRMNPQDIELLNLLAPEQAKKMTGLTHIHIVSDDSVEVGGCIVSTNAGNIDTQISTQIEKIVSQLAPDMKDSIESWCEEVDGSKEEKVEVD